MKPLFSNSDPMSNKIALVKNWEILQEENRVAETLNSYFFNIIDTLGLDPFFPYIDQNGTVDQVVNQATEKYKNHDSILRIKKRQKISHPSNFPHVNPWEISKQMNALITKRSIKRRYTVEGPQDV